jgi:hypothetical protein
MLALRHWTPLLLDLEQRAVGVFAGGRSMTLYACFAAHHISSQSLFHYSRTHHAYFLLLIRTCRIVSPRPIFFVFFGKDTHHFY